jgi:hypothetical protein
LTNTGAPQTRRLILLCLALLTLTAAAAAPASASTVADCQTEIAALDAATASAQFFGQNADKSRTGLRGKLADASAKLDEGKFADATVKLTQFRDQVAALAGQGKLASTDADTLTMLANDAIACISPIAA